MLKNFEQRKQDRAPTLFVLNLAPAANLCSTTINKSNLNQSRRNMTTRNFSRVNAAPNCMIPGNNELRRSSNVSPLKKHSIEMSTDLLRSN